jgi:hypothetical protein
MVLTCSICIQQTATAAQNAVGNLQLAAANLNQVTVQAKQVMADFQSRDLFGKAEATLNNTKDASRQLAETSQQVNLTLADVLGPDHLGENAGQNDISIFFVPKIGCNLSSARISRLFCGFCSLCFLMCTQIFFVTSLRGSGSVPTILAK